MKYTLFECIDCKETYLADNLCDGYKCPECGGMVIEIGSLEGAEEAIEEMTNKVNKAKRNGLIRKYKRKDDDIKVTRTLYANNEEFATITVNFNTEKVE